jgi:U3 small nucleolar RNA-associated protein 14
VILNEKQDKKFNAKLVQSLPFPFTCASQYNKAHRNPIGKEWNTPKTLRQNLKAKVFI